MEELKFNVHKNYLTIPNPFRPHIHLATDTVHYLLTTFEFDSTWDGFEKRVYFKNASYNIVRGVLLGDSNTCYIPWEVLAHTGVIRCNVIGLKYSDETVTQRITTNPVVFEILVDESVLEPYDQQPLTPTEYEQFRITFENVYSSTLQARDAAIDAKDIAVEIAATLDAPVEEAEDFSKTSEAYAVGTRGGVPVDEDDDTYNNNSKYYSELAKDYVDNISYALPDIVDDWLNEHPEATTTVQDGAITDIKLAYPLRYKVNRPAIINVASFVDGVLTNDNIGFAITQALVYSKYIYIPEGNYTFNISIDEDCTIYLDDECYISTDNEYPCIYASGCSVNITGGNIYSGVNDDSRVPVYSGGGHSTKGIIVFENCSQCHISDIKTSHSKYGSVYQIKDCDQFIFENLSLENMLMTGIRILDHCTNIIVRNCSFKNIDRITGPDYCYAVSTGTATPSVPFTPPDNILYENNYVYDSEDCALDCHGGTNITIRNNKIIETVNAITAYNDNLRIKRPAGWNMRNVLIENNYCESSKDNEVGREYPHPYFFFGAENWYSETEVGHEDNGGNYYAFSNCVIRNNYIKSPNTHQFGLICLSRVSRDVIIENNTIDGCGSETTRSLMFLRSFGFIFRNNTGMNLAKPVYFELSWGEVERNIGFKYDFNNLANSLVYVKGMGGDVGEIRGTLVKSGDILYVSNALSVCTSYGYRLRDNVTFADFNVTITDGVAVMDVPTLLPRMALYLNGSTSAYVQDILAPYKCILVNGSNALIPDGTYTAKVRAATFSTL